jgi:site-specific DNA recombinase
MIRRNETPKSTPTVRCAIYTRKSTEEGLEQEFNSLDAQRESAEAFIASQRHDGWQCLPNHYDDGGFTGGNMDRPALRRLLADIEAGKVDCVVVYKVDRLSRSLLDFARMMETFEQHNISFVSVTQQFNTATSMGRLVLNVLLSFAQFEREMISERTRDKIAATRRKGKWSGGRPILGYDVVDTKLVVNPVEADRVRQIFAMYLENRSLIATVAELNRRGWTTKCWTTRKQIRRGGRPFIKSGLYHLLTNVAYIGRVRYKTEVHDGEHQGIVDEEVFRRTQVALQRNGRSGSLRNKHGALLKGLLRCAACGCHMTHTYTVKGQRRYRYYVCVQAQQRGWQTCPSPSVPAGEMEKFVVNEIRAIGRDPAVVAATVAATRAQAEEASKALAGERAALGRQRRDDEAELRRRTAKPVTDEYTAGLVADLQDRIRRAERRLTEITEEQFALAGELVDAAEVARVLAEFGDLWGALTPREQMRVVDLLVERVDYDGQNGSLSITFRPTGIKTLGVERDETEEYAA